MKSWAAVLILFLCSLEASAQAAGAVGSAAKCMRALRAFEVALEQRRSTVGAEWLRGKRAELMLFAGVGPDVRSESGNFADIRLCSEHDIGAPEIGRFVMAFHGYLGPSAMTELIECHAGFVLQAESLNRRLGTATAASVDRAHSRWVARAVVQLGELFPPTTLAGSEFLARTERIVQSASALPNAARVQRGSEMLKRCAALEIETQSVIDAHIQP